MDRLEIKGNWTELKGAIKSRWGFLTDDDLTYAEGKEDQMLGKIEKKTGQTREEIVDYINSLDETNK